jgi:chromosome segregation ATPase
LHELEDARANSEPDSFWTQLESVIQHHEVRMKALAQQAAALEASLSDRQRSSSSTHATRMSQGRAELAALRSEVDAVTAEIEELRPAHREEVLRAQILRADHQLKEATRTVNRLRQSNADLKGELIRLMDSANSGADAMKRRVRDGEARARELSAEIEATQRNIHRVEDDLEELEAREAACRLLMTTLGAPDHLL